METAAAKCRCGRSPRPYLYAEQFRRYCHVVQSSSDMNPGTRRFFTAANPKDETHIRLVAYTLPLVYGHILRHLTAIGRETEIVGAKSGSLALCHR